MRPVCLTLSLVGVLAVSPAMGQDAEPDLEQLLTRAGRYVQRHDRELGGIAAQETFDQKLFKQRNSGLLKMRSVRSDVVFMSAPNDFRWAALRDTFEVDGKPVREGGPRLEKLFLEAASPEAALEHAAPIVEKSAAHDLGGSARNFNIPTLALAFLHPDNQPRFRFTRKGKDTVEGVAAWAVDYAEQQSPAFIRDAEGRDLYGSGTVWIDPADGKIVRTYFKVSDAAGLFQVELTTTFRYWSENALWVPREMRESRSYKPQAVDRVPTRRVESTQTMRTADGRIVANPRFGSSVGGGTDSTSGVPTEHVETVAQYSGYRRFGDFAPAAALAAAAPVNIDHAPVACVSAGRFPAVRACFQPASGVGRANVHFRAAGTPHWYAVEMAVDGRCHLGYLPQPAAKSKSVEYFIDLVTTAAVEARTRRYEARVSRDAGTCGESAPTRPELKVLAGADGPPLPDGFVETALVSAPAPAGWIVVDPAAARTIRSGRSKSSGRTDDMIALGVGSGLLASGAYIKLTNHDAPVGGDPEDDDGDGYTEALGDCNDARRDVRPGAGFSGGFSPYAFLTGTTVSCGAPNARQQVYRVANMSCEPLQVESLRYTLETSGAGCTAQGFSEELGLGARSIAAGQTATIRLGVAAGLAWPMCCPSGQCPTGSCRFTERYTLRTSAGERTYTNQFTIGDAAACRSCDLPETSRRAY